MGFRDAGPALVKAWLSWLRRSAFLRLFGLPAALLVLYLELYGSSPVVASLILHRLRRRLQLSASCTRKYGQDMSAILALAHAASTAADSPIPARPPGLRTLSPNHKGARSSRPARRRTKSAASTAYAFSPTTSPPPPPSSRRNSLLFSPPPPPPSSASHLFSTPSYSSPRMPTHARSKTASHIDLVRQGKRLSLQFPIQPAAGSTSPHATPPATRPQSWIASPSPFPTAASDSAAQSSPAETNILAVLASQERYVLELKEELNKAEADLKMLKKHYAQHEASKRRNDVRRTTPLQPLNTLLANVSPEQQDDADPSPSTLSVQREFERRKALLNSAKTPQRKVFSGQRHLRTLSLLSPERTYSPSFPQPLDLLSDEQPTVSSPRPTLPAHALTSPDLRKQVVEEQSMDDQFDQGGLPNMQREKIIRAGTQIAADFKNGLFTFIEDLRQATVGDEAVNENEDLLGPTKPTRKAADGRPGVSRTASSKASSQRTGSIGEDFWKENGLSEAKSAKNTQAAKSLQTPQKQTTKSADEDEDWISWDTPNDGYATNTTDQHNSSDESDEAGSLVSGQSSTRPSTSSTGLTEDFGAADSKRNSTPWSDLAKLSPNNIKRTASHLMKEWEKQLTPPIEARMSGHAHGDYMGRSSSPPSLI